MTLPQFMMNKKTNSSKLYKRKTQFGWADLSLKNMETSGGLMVQIVISIIGQQVLISSLVLFDHLNLLTGEPHRKTDGRNHHECTFLGGKSQGKLVKGYWYDGVCRWDQYFFDCLCKK